MREIRKMIMLYCVCLIFTTFMGIFSDAKVKWTVKKNYQAFEYTNLTFSHAESPVYDADTDTLYWVDVLNQNVHSLDYKTKKHRYKHIEYGEVNVVVPVFNSNRLLVAVRAEVFLMDWTKPGDSSLRLVTALEPGKPNNILNEGKADARGRFWGGTKGPQLGDDVAPDQGALYSIQEPDFNPIARVMPVSISNGLAWSINGSIFYYIDSYTMKIDAFDYDITNGRLSKRRTILDISKSGFKNSIPDGMTIDNDDMLWIALMFDGSVIRVNPHTKTIVEQYHMPVKRTTSVAWAGPNMEDLVVTTSRRNMVAKEIEEEPLSGAIFILHQLNTRGRPDSKVKFSGADEY